jgi:hypothetical protein
MEGTEIKSEIESFEVEASASNDGAVLNVKHSTSKVPVEIIADIYGEKVPMLSAMVYDADESEGCVDEGPALTVRFNLDGTVAEIAIRKDLKDKVVDYCQFTRTDWEKQRDGVE